MPARLINGNDIALVGREQADVFSLTVFLNQERIITALDADLRPGFRTAEALGPGQKERAFATLAEEQLALDREIAELVLRAHAQGLNGIEL